MIGCLNVRYRKKSFIKVVRFCKTIYKKSALKSGKFRIGTFYLYKKIENKILQDKEEGMAKYTYVGRKQLTEEDNDKLFANSPYKLTNGWEIEMNGCPTTSRSTTI